MRIHRELSLNILCALPSESATSMYCQNFLSSGFFLFGANVVNNMKPYLKGHNLHYMDGT